MCVSATHVPPFDTLSRKTHQHERSWGADKLSSRHLRSLSLKKKSNAIPPSSLCQRQGAIIEVAKVYPMSYLLEIMADPGEPHTVVFTSPSTCVLVENNLLKASSAFPHVVSQRPSIWSWSRQDTVDHRVVFVGRAHGVWKSSSVSQKLLFPPLALFIDFSFLVSHVRSWGFHFLWMFSQPGGTANVTP